MVNEINNDYLSLLYPEGTLSNETSGCTLEETSAQALEIYSLIDLRSCDIGSFFTTDPDTIRYRQEVFSDLSDFPEVTTLLKKMLPFLSDITELRRIGSDPSESTETYLYSITEIELYTSLLDLLKNGLKPYYDKFKSRALRAFSEKIRLLTESDYYKELNIKLNELTSRVREIKSVTIGVNLDAQLRPDFAGVLSLNNDTFKSGEILDKILRLDFKKDEMTCIAPLTPAGKGQSENAKIAMSHAFTSAINNIFRSSVRSWKKIIQTYILENTDFLLRMIPEIEFVTKSAELIITLKEKKLPLIYPEIMPMEQKNFTVKGLCNPVVAIKLDAPIVPNDFTFDENGMIYVLTGPNRGGKSVITCAVGLAFVMGQLGLPICAQSASMSPCDGIFTHFPTESEDTIDKGRLGEECARLRAMIDKVTEYSVVLLDESLSSTGSFEGAYIAAEVLSGFSIIRLRGIFSTHLHDLAASVQRLNKECIPRGGVKIDNLVAQINDGGQRTFCIIRKEPDGHSYAKDIAEKYGLSLEKIMEKVEKPIL